MNSIEPEKATDTVIEILKSDANLKFDLHNCSICGYTCGFMWQGQLKYDNGCSCSWSGLAPRNRSDLLQHFEWNKNNEHSIKQYNDFIQSYSGKTL